MKIGIFSDIHGNLYAFEKVLERLKKEKLDRYIFCGDLCGYYYHQNVIAEMLESLENLVSVMGNHDKLFLDALEDEARLYSYSERYGNSLRELRTTVSPRTLFFLRSLPEHYVDPEIDLAVFHGSPWNPLCEYIYPTDPIERFNALPYRYVILGHTHYAMLRRANGIQIINPGSCGQPRDANLPSFSVLDTESGEVRFERIPYDLRPLIAEIKSRNETNPYLVQVLQR